MPENELVFSRSYDLPAAIVWDALVDEVLVDGWLAPARVDARIGGEYLLDWEGGTGLAPTHGVITEIVPEARLAIDTDNAGHLEFSLFALEGGTRGSATTLTLRLRVQAEPRLLAGTKAHWRSSFDQLEGLLRGHPVDWATWQRDRGETWAEYLRASSREE